VSAGNLTPAVVDSAEIAIAGESDSADLTSPEAVTEAAPENFSTAGKLPPPADELVPPAPDRYQIKLSDGDRPAAIEQAEKVLASGFFSRGQSIVRIGEARQLPESLTKIAKEHRIRRPDDQRAIITCLPSYLATEITRLSDVWKYNPQSDPPTLRKTDFPETLARALIERKTWQHLRPLDAIVRAPFVRPDGTIHDAPGYDELSRCFADFDPDEFDQLPKYVSEDEAAHALTILLAPFDQFPFASDAARSAFVCHTLTEAARTAFECSPLFCYSAPDSSMGKTLLSEIAGTIVHGERPAMRPWIDDKHEMKKTLFASLLAGDRSIIFDNVPNGSKVRSPELCAFITASPYKDRVLGESGVIGLPNTAVVAASGNNITPVSDLARRSLVIRLDGNTASETLRERRFKIPDLRGHVLSNRAKLLTAALTTIRARQQSDFTSNRAPLPSFERWDYFVRDTVLWLGLPDPVETQKNETDNESSTQDAAFERLAVLFGDRAFSASDILSQVRSMTDMEGKLAEALLGAGCSDPQDAVRIGYWLRANRDRFGAGLKLTLVVMPNGKHSNKYRLQRGATSAGPNADLV
jgi:hypothetical protein